MLGIGLAINKKKIIKKSEALNQKWLNYPDSPLLTSEYPYQCVYGSQYSDTLVMAKNPLVKSGNLSVSNGYMMYREKTGPWIPWLGPVSSEFNMNGETIAEANNDIYGDYAKTVVYFAKTTT